MENTFDFYVSTHPGDTGRNKIVVNGLDLSRAVRSFQLESETGKVAHLELDLVNLSAEGAVGRGVVVINVVKDGWHLCRVATPEILGAIAHLHDLLDEEPMKAMPQTDPNSPESDPVPADDEQPETA